MCAFQVIVLKRTPKEAWDLFNNVYFLEFRDASVENSNYLCSIFHCLQSLYRAISLSWYDFYLFDTNSYDYYSHISNGDIN